MTPGRDGGESPALQDRYTPDGICFGCGPANPDGLRLRSHPGVREGSEVVAEWTPGPNHRSFPGVLNGGIIGTLLDCQSNWCAAHYFMRARGLEHPPVTVTAEYTVRLRKPTPSGAPAKLRARIVEAGARKVVVEAELRSGGERTATCSGTFVAIEEGHPAHAAR